MKNMGTAVVMTVIGLGLGAVIFRGADEPAAHAPPADARSVEAPSPEQSAAEQATPGLAAEETELGLETSRALTDDGIVYGAFVIGAASQLGPPATLFVEPAAGVVIEDVVGSPYQTNGKRAEIDLTNLALPATIVVRLDLGDSATATIRAHVKHRGGGASEVLERDISSSHQDTRVIVRARQALTEQALQDAQRLREARKFSEALELVETARAKNVEAGMVLRVSGDLKSAQAELDEVKAELLTAMRPKKVRRPKPTKKPGIEFVRGDA